MASMGASLVCLHAIPIIAELLGRVYIKMLSTGFVLQIKDIVVCGSYSLLNFAKQPPPPPPPPARILAKKFNNYKCITGGTVRFKGKLRSCSFASRLKKWKLQFSSVFVSEVLIALNKRKKETCDTKWLGKKR